MLSKYIDHHKIYLFGLIALAVSLPLSLFTTSVAEIILISNWLLEGKFKQKWDIFRKRKSLWFIGSIYLVHLIGLIFTSNFDYALHDLKIKLPFLILPLVIGTTSEVTRKELKWILVFFIGAITVSTLASTSVLFGIIPYEFHDTRQISLFVDHIRFSLLINIAIFSIFYMLLGKGYKLKKPEFYLYVVVLIWLILFLGLLQALTGILVFMVTSFILFWMYLKEVRHLVLKWFLAVMVITVSFLVISYVTKAVDRFYSVEEVDPDKMDSTTSNGNPYTHILDSKQIENGYYVWIYLCEDELRKEWNKRSTFDFDGKDKLGQDLRHTLIRYLTSKGFRKDSLGMSKLSANDIDFVENGIANYIYGRKYSLYPKLYEVIWQVDVFRRGGNPSGHSITQRILYLEAALGIISDHFWTGVGTGDVKDSFHDYYEKTNSQLDKSWRLRAHNQYLTFLLTFGIIGFLWILFSMVYPAFIEKKWADYLFIMFFIIGFLSMLNEDTLETHIGNSFFSFFYALFLLGTKVNSAKTERD